ncbi:MAG: class 1 fructose-bisphosphatase, partial [Proteobacteria bacterium]|nr:class 1 fructose-bisphosphatase [Pseudomonadota bacterium]
MHKATTLEEHCARAVAAGSVRGDVAGVVQAMGGVAIELAAVIALGSLSGAPGAAVGSNKDGDVQKELDVRSHRLAMTALKKAGVAFVASEECDDVEVLDPQGTLAVAIDPLDGSSNIDTNISIGTIFSILPAENIDSKLGPFGGAGHRQLAAGFFVYGPQTALVLTFGSGVDIFTLDARDHTFRLTRSQVRIPPHAKEYAINASNYLHWDAPIRIYIDDCLNGENGVRGANFNMRWIASLVAEAFRILARGGIFLYPADARKGYENGRLRLLYEAAPMAFVMEQAGGMASTGRERILDLVPTSLHQRVPLIFGAADKVQRVARLHEDPHLDAERAPLFASRGLF